MRDFIGFSHSTERLRGSHVLISFFRVRIFLEPSRHEGSLDASRTDAIDSNAFSGVIERERFREADDGKFCRAVSQSITNTDHAADGCEVDNIARLLHQHTGQKRLRDIEDTADIDSVKPVQILSSRLHHRADMSDAGIVHQDIESQLAPVNLLRGLLAMILIGDIQSDELGLALLVRYSRDGFSSALFVSVTDKHVRLRLSKNLGNGRSDARSGTGD